MKKHGLFLIVVLVSLVLTGCLGGLKQQAESGEQGMAAALFDTYSKLAAAENGVSVIAVENPSPASVWLKITAAENEDAWKLVEIPGEDTVQIEVGTADYLLQLQSNEGEGVGNVLPVTAGNASVVITGDQFGLSVP